MTSALPSPPVSSVPLTDLALMTAEVRTEVEAAWSRILSDCSFVGGADVERFEADWAALCGTRHAVGVANGTDAIELTLRGLGIGRGDEVIVPANTFIATVEAVVLAGAAPRFVDVDDDTLLVTPEIVRAALSDRTAAVIAVDLYGDMPRLDELADLAARAGIVLVEDAAQAHGSTWRGKAAGSFGVAGCFSFYPTKNLGAFGDAGCVVTDDSGLADALRSLANHGRRSGARDLHAVVGRNSRLDNLQASVLLAKLARLDVWNAARRSIAKAYTRSLSGEVIRAPMSRPDAVSSYHQYVVRVDDRDGVRRALSRSGIGTGVHYPVPCHHHDPYRKLASEPLPVVERSAGEILSLPMFPQMSAEQIAQVCTCLNAAVEGIHG